jgi:septum formation protein
MNTLPPIVLASGSPRRSELLQQVGVRFEVLPADIDESRRKGEPPVEYVRRMACEKALEGHRQSTAGNPVLGADTVVVLGEEIFGKPVSRADARDMLRQLSGCTHEVLSAVALVMPDGDLECRLSRSRVTFSDIPDDWIHQYCKSNEPMDKAGAYAIQGSAAGWISLLEGSHSSVMGLPLFETLALLREIT